MEVVPWDGTLAVRLQLDETLWDAAAASHLAGELAALLVAAAADSAAPPARRTPQGEMIERVAAIWAEVLGLPRVGAHDSFWQLGGHSAPLPAPQRNKKTSPFGPPRS
jgi:hypothetical protein